MALPEQAETPRVKQQDEPASLTAARRPAPDALAGGGRAVARCRSLGRPPFSNETDMLDRAYLTPAHAAASRQLTLWMEEAGMTVRRDAAANVVGRYDGTEDGPALMIGSHIDSVRDGGLFDGPLGIMLGIECVTALRDRSLRLPFAVEVIAFGDEEGSRFPNAMLTSRAVAGTLPSEALDVADADGVSLAAALADAGLDVTRFRSAARRREQVRAYLEAHIEQGPVLEAEGLALGVVTGIAGQRRLAVTLAGAAGHAGTSAMNRRRDALAAAAEAVLAVERVARDGPEDLVATVGRLAVAPGAVNVVPGRAEFSIDIRAGSDAVRDAATEAILATIEAMAARRGIALMVDETHVLAAAPCDSALTGRLADAIAAIGQKPRRMVSGAGHDAMVMAALAPTAMLFIRCAGGVSHNPAEDVMAEDVEMALKAMLAFVEGLAA